MYMESYVFISIRLKFDLEFVHVLYLESTLPSDQFCSKEKFVKFYFGKMLSLFQVFHSFFQAITQWAFIYSKSSMKKLEQYVKSVQR